LTLEIALVSALAAVIAALVSALVSVLTSERRIAMENVTQERTKWREKIRELSAAYQTLILVDEGHDGKLRELKATFSLRVNPHDADDQRLLQLLSENNTEMADEFIQRVSLLLKHDWERAKHEASLWRSLCETSPTRIAFEDYRPGFEHNYRVCKVSVAWAYLLNLVGLVRARLRR
jgi:hypothetical protein